MKSTSQLFLICFLLTVHNLLGQTSSAKTIFDSSFTLTKRLDQDKLSIGQHGVFFNERTKQVFNDFKTIRNLSLTNLTQYKKQVILDDHHLLKIWTATKPLESVSTIIEINSVYPIDTTDEGSKLKDTIIYNDYFFQFKDTTKNVHYQTIDKQGVSKYSISNRQVYTNREMILVGLFYVDNTDKIKRLLDKYNYAQHYAY